MKKFARTSQHSHIQQGYLNQEPEEWYEYEYVMIRVFDNQRKKYWCDKTRNGIQIPIEDARTAPHMSPSYH